MTRPEPLVCPEADALLPLASGEPDPELEEHLRQCPECRQKLERLKSTVDHIRQSVASTEAPMPTWIPAVELPAVPTRPAAVGKYLVVGELGAGGQARVFRGLHPTLGRDVAIKWSHRAAAGDNLDCLLREGKLLSELDHAAIVRVFDLDVHEGRPFLVMEYIRGSNLEQYAAREPITPRQAAALVASLARGLAAAHARGIVHQDIKPTNVLMDEAGRPRLSDFGLARWQKLWAKRDEQQPSGGTLAYMAPEQLTDPEAVDAVSDLYGLGGVLFFLLTGKPPRQDLDNPALSWQQVLHGEIDWTSLRERKVPRTLVDICKKALAQKPADRYLRATDFAADLERFVQKPLVWKRRLGLAGACAACLALGVALVAFFNRQTTTLEVPSPGPQATAKSAPINLRILRGSKDYSPQTQQELEQLLPVRSDDQLSVWGQIPAGIKAALFAATLSEAELEIQELGPLEISGNQFKLSKLFPLEGSPATELLLLCGSAQRPPIKQDVAALLVQLASAKSPKTPKLLLPENKTLTFLSDRVEAPLTRVGPLADDPQKLAFDKLEAIRGKLRGKYEFVAGLAFTHYKQAADAAAERGQIKGPGAVKNDLQVEGGSEEDRELFNRVLDRLLQTSLVRDHYPADFVWPPRAYILPQSIKKFNAYAGPISVDAATGKLIVRAVITEGYMKEIVDGDANRLAAIMGHELAHITRGHLNKYRKFDLAGLVLSREQEIEADLEGMKIAVAAGFPYRSGRDAAFQEWKVLGDYSNFEGIKATHPSWTERLQFLAREESQIWKTMSAFQNGYFFLHAEQYSNAEHCFDYVTKDFPDCAEAWANLGYARLMQYCDGLDENDLRDLKIGQFVAGCFYGRPESLGRPRGPNKVLWEEAVQALKTALKRDPNLMLVRANLGLAYLVHPDGRQIDVALDYFRKAPNLKDKGLSDLSAAAFLVNFGVAEMAGGLPQQAAEKFRKARQLLPTAKQSVVRSQLLLALLFNEAVLADAAPDRDAKAKAFGGLEQYLTVVGPGSQWLNLAYEQYQKLGAGLEKKTAPRESFTKSNRAQLLRPLTSVELAPGKVVTLSDSTTEALKLLGRDHSIGVPVFYRSTLKRYFNVGPGVDLLGSDKVLAVFLTNDKAPVIFVQPQGLGAKPVELRVGMPVQDLRTALGGQPQEDAAVIVDASVQYVFLPYLGLAYRIRGDRVAELVLTQVARKGGANNGQE